LSWSSASCFIRSYATRATIIGRIDFCKCPVGRAEPLKNLANFVAKQADGTFHAVPFSFSPYLVVLAALQTYIDTLRQPAAKCLGEALANRDLAAGQNRLKGTIPIVS
jgi:hypothetical protein